MKEAMRRFEERMSRAVNIVFGGLLTVFGVVGLALFVSAAVVAVSVSQDLVRWPVEWLLWYRDVAPDAGFWLAGLVVLFAPFYLMSEARSRLRSVGWWAFIGIVGGGAAAAAPMMANLDVFEYSNVKVRGDRVYLCGSLPLESRGGLVDVLEQRRGEGPWTLVLKDNEGGHVSAARRIHQRLGELDVDKVVAVGRCNSACALLWTLANNRSLAANSVIGFHGPFYVDGAPDEKEVEKQVSDMVGAGFTEQFSRDMMAFGQHNMGYVGAESVALERVSFERVERTQDDILGCEDR